MESKTAVADEAMKKLEATDAEIQDKSDQIEANQAEIEPLKQEFIETEAAAGAESDKDAKMAELETAVNAKNEELEAKNQEQSSLQAASQGFKNILPMTGFFKASDFVSRTFPRRLEINRNTVMTAR